MQMHHERAFRLQCLHQKIEFLNAADKRVSDAPIQ
jgi:hypothetical protein